MQAATIGESMVAPKWRGDTPHPHDRQGQRGGIKVATVKSVSEIPPAEAARLLDDLTLIVARACAVIRDVSPATVVQRVKPDDSPVTAADEASQAVILEGLARVLPGVPIVSEESTGHDRGKLGENFLIVDPLDGTREFLAGRDEFTVNLAIISGGIPLAGIIAAPKRDRLWRGIVGGKSERLRLLRDGADQPHPIHTREWPPRGAIAAISRSHFDARTDAFLDSVGPIQRLPSGSAIKFCQVAEGAADVYPRFATTCEWDVAAGHALVTAAGGIVSDAQGVPLTYGRAAQDFRVPSFIAWGDPGKAAAAS